MSTAAYVARAEDRARKSGHKAWLNDDGTFRVKSRSNPDQWWDVAFLDVVEPGALVLFSCPCPAGQHRREPEPCWHAGRAALRLRREGLAVQRDGLTYWRDDVDLPESSPAPVSPAPRGGQGSGPMPPMPPHPAERNWSGAPPRPVL